MNVKMFEVGALLTNCYVAWCVKTRQAIVIDPGFERQFETERILDFLRESELKVKLIVDTHGDHDHTCGNGAIKSVTDAPILIHKLDADILGENRMVDLPDLGKKSPRADGFLEDGDFLRFGDDTLKVLHTPGHSPGSISLLGEGCVFTGDTLFAGSVGRVDLPGGSGEAMMHSLLERLAVLPDNLVVYPGHGPQSTMGEEKRNNPFLQKGYDASFLY